MKTTPGRWAIKIEEIEDGLRIPCVVAPNPLVDPVYEWTYAIARTYGEVADAKLMAAAKEMLSAIRLIHSQILAQNPLIPVELGHEAEVAVLAIADRLADVEVDE